MATIKDAIQEMVDELKNVSGLRRVPDALPESNDQFPFATLIPASGKFEMQSSGWMVGLHNVEIHLHVQRKDLARAYEDIMPLLTDIPMQLMSGLLNERFDALETWGGEDSPITYTWAASSWQDTPTLAYIFTVPNVKVTDTIA